MIDISVSFKINMCIDGELTVGNIVKAISEIGVEKEIATDIIEKINEEAVNEYCGEKYSHGNGENRYQRANTFTRIVKTIIGELNLKLNKIIDTSKIKDKIFAPIYEKIKFIPHKNFQEDISLACAEMATKMTYRDTEKELKHFIKENEQPSHSTIWQMVKSHGGKIKKFRKEKNKKQNNSTEKLGYFSCDSTKTHSQLPNKNKNDIKVGLGFDNNGEAVLFDVQVNENWEKMDEVIKELDILADDACLIADAEKGLRNALVYDKKHFQIDSIHYIRDTSYKLWADSKLELNQRKAIIKKLQSIVYHQINSTKKYANNEIELKKRINTCVSDLKSLSDELIVYGCFKAAKFVKDYSNFAVTYSMLSLEGKNVPWNSNVIERLMGEIQKRCKHKWMRWGTEGQEAILDLILTQYISPQIYEEYKNHILENKNLKNINTKMKKI